MTELYAVMKQDWLLRGWKDVPYAAVNWKNGDFRELSKEAFHVAKDCNGRTDFASMAYLPRQRKILQKLIQEGIVSECGYEAFIDPDQEYRYAPNPLIRGLLWSVTGRCNLNCRHCFMEAPSRKYEKLKFEQLIELMNKFTEANVTEIALTGGEPFLREDLAEVLNALTERKIGIAEIFSNGTLITEGILRTIRELGHHPFFKISFDCCNNHDDMRGVPGCEKKTIEGIKLLKSQGYPVAIISSLDRVKWPDIVETYELLKELKVEGWWLAPPVEIGEWRKQEKSFSIKDMVDISQKLLKLWLKDGRPFDLKLWRFGLFTKEGTEHDFGIRQAKQITPESWNCAGTHTRPYLMPDGTLLPCGSYTGTELHKEFPNVFQTSLMEAWSAPAIRKICDLKKGDILVFNEGCQGCEYYGECGSGCRVVAITETGKLIAKDPVACMLFKGGYIKRFRDMAKSELEWIEES